MRWRGRRQSSNIQDIRGQSRGSGFGRGGFRLPSGFGRGGGFRLPGGFGRGVNLPGGFGRGRPTIRRTGGGGLIIGLIVVALILFFVFGISPMALLGGL